MLRILFGEQTRQWQGASLDTVQVMESFAQVMAKLSKKYPERSTLYLKYEIGAQGLIRSMDELEQSIYAANQYSKQIIHTHVDELTTDEQLSYDRHVYFDKNSYIRVFAILDKLGTLLNEVLELRTEKLKPRFSFFTMLRNLRENRQHIELMKPLAELKDQHQAALNRLRDRRNLEIHQMNAELKDDLRQALAKNGKRVMLENLKMNMSDLNEGWEMVQGSLSHSFHYACEVIRRW